MKSGLTKSRKMSADSSSRSISAFRSLPARMSRSYHVSTDVPQKGAGRQGPDRRRPEPCRLLHRDKLHVSRSEPGFRPMPGPPPAPNLSRRPAASTPWDFAGDASRDRVSAIRLTASDRPGRKLRHRRSGPPAPICVRLRPFDVRQVRNHADRRSRPARQLRSGHVVAPEGISRAEAALGRRMRNKIA